MIWNCHDFKKYNKKTYKEYVHFLIFIFILKLFWKKLCIGTTINIIYNNLQKISLQNYMKNLFLGKKTCSPYLK